VLLGAEVQCSGNRGSRVILFRDAEKIEKLSATAVNFCFELMWLVIEVFVICVFDV
jgi:hypothetical protein